MNKFWLHPSCNDKSFQYKKYKPMRLLTGVSCLERVTKVSATSLSLSAPLRSPWNFWER